MSIIYCQAEKMIIRRNRLSKCLRLSINHQGKIHLSVPFYCSQKQINAFLKKYQNWINEQKKKCSPIKKFTDQEEISFLGKQLIITHQPDTKQGTHIQGNQLIVSGNINFLDRRITDFIKENTLLYINQKATQYAKQLNASFNKIHIKDTTSRWGSCSGKGNLNFCWRLALAPLFVLDYVIAHEVSHLKEMNHGAKFWETVDKLITDRKQAEHWLKQHGQELR